MGYVFIHNASNNTVDLFNHKGELLQQLGGNGNGPGELHKLVTFHYNPDSGRLYLLDEQKVEIFKRGDNRLFEYYHTFHSGYQRSFDICELNDSIFISGYGFQQEDQSAVMNGETNIFDVSDFLGPIISFETNNFSYKKTLGYKIPSFSGIGQSSGMISQSWLHCNRETGVIVSDLFYYPLTIGFHPNGSIKWVTKLNDITSTEFLETENNGRPAAYAHSNKQISHRKSRVGYTPGKYALLNISTALPQEYFSRIDKTTEDNFKIEFLTFLLDTEDGSLQRVENNKKKIEVIGIGFFVDSTMDLDKYIYEVFYKNY